MKERDKNSKMEQFRQNIKSRKAFSMAINDKSMPNSILRLGRFAHILLLALITIAVAGYAIVFK